MLTPLPVVLQVLLVLIVVTAGIYDLRYRRIPNWLVLAGLVLGIGLNTFLFDLEGLKRAALGMGLALLIYFPLYALRAMGAGDAKLMAAVGSIVGWQNWIVLFVVTALLGGLTAGARVRIRIGAARSALSPDTETLVTNRAVRAG